VLYKLTLDVNLMEPSVTVPGMDVLRRWKEEGKVDLIEANRPQVVREPAYGWPGAPAKPVERNPNQRGGKRRSGKMNESGNANFKSIAAVLFPSKDHLKLSMAEINNVAHLIRHHLVKNEIFVTANKKDFIEEGRRDRLKSNFGIVIMTPEEVIEALCELQGWESGVIKEKAVASGGKSRARK
jgi:hypothetical protein